jgi:hypothetical protein
MSWKVLGVLDISENIKLNLKEKVFVAFLIVEKATKYKIGAKLGGNIFPSFRKFYKETHNSVLFELTDDPMDINADNLFASEYAPEADVSSDDHFHPRMQRIQGFLKELLEIDGVDKVVLNINIIDGNDIKIVTTNIDNFYTTLLKLYRETKDFWMPTVRVIVCKSQAQK